MTKTAWRDAYRAYRLFWRLNSLWCAADNAHRARPVFQGERVTAKRMRTVGDAIARPLWLVLSSVRSNADNRSRDGARAYAWITATSDNVKSYAATLARFDRPDYRPRVLRVTSEHGDCRHYYPLAAPSGGWRYKEGARNLRELRAAGLVGSFPAPNLP